MATHRKKVERRMISPQDLAKRWDVHYRTILERVASGEYPGIKVGNRVRIPMDWVEKQERLEPA